MMLILLAAVLSLPTVSQFHPVTVSMVLMRDLSLIDGLVITSNLNASADNLSNWIIKSDSL